MNTQEIKNRLATIVQEVASLYKIIEADEPVFPLDAFDMPRRAVDMFYPDLAEARRMWLDESKPETHPDGFLSQLNAQNQRLDFHALRHTCGAWLALAGVQPKIIQSVMRHSSITLTLDTYGHLMPGAEQDAAGVLASLLSCQ